MVRAVRTATVTMGYIYNNSLERRTPLKAKTSMKRTAMKPKRKKICLWVGKKTRQWITVRARLKRRFDAASITTCELGYPGCWKDESLGFAHGRKRRQLKDNEIETLTILVCNPCHDKIEVLSAPAMLAIVQSVIAERGWGSSPVERKEQQ